MPRKKKFNIKLDKIRYLLNSYTWKLYLFPNYIKNYLRKVDTLGIDKKAQTIGFCIVKPMF